MAGDEGEGVERDDDVTDGDADVTDDDEDVTDGEGDDVDDFRSSLNRSNMADFSLKDDLQMALLLAAT